MDSVDFRGKYLVDVNVFYKMMFFWWRVRGWSDRLGRLFGYVGFNMSKGKGVGMRGEMWVLVYIGIIGCV